MGNIYILVEFNAGFREQQRKFLNTLFIFSILNQMYDIQTELYNQGKQYTLCKVPAHIGIKGNKEADIAAKQRIDMPGMTTIRLPYADYYLTG